MLLKSPRDKGLTLAIPHFGMRGQILLVFAVKKLGFRSNDTNDNLHIGLNL